MTKTGLGEGGGALACEVRRPETRLDKIARKVDILRRPNI